ncbi:HNH endonuclease [Clostridium sp.]|uniref:HNH endonuclease n=1 Tax=Clostridium sp. TaxID=1506 RepID=UPI0026043885|nr:HNH endonuclease [Clostridium sp.]
MALKKMCPRCGKIIDYGLKYCDECEKKYKKNKTESNKYYDKNIRKSEDNLKYAKFYDNILWKKLAEYIRRKYNGLCLMCLLKDNRINHYDVIHHILEIKSDEGWIDRLNSDGVVPLCHAHHNWLHGNYTKDKVQMLRDLIKTYEDRYE